MNQTAKTIDESSAAGRPNEAAKGLIVINPSAGSEELQELRSTISSVLGEDTAVFLELSEEMPLCDALQRAVKRNSFQWVAAAGGDGTVSLVGGCLARSKMPLGIIPAGTGNALAGALGIPADIEEACRLLLNSSAKRQIDALRVAGNYYFLQLGVGLEALTMKETSSSLKEKIGELAYLWTAAKEARGWQPQLFNLTVDGVPYDIEASELVLANAADVGVLDLQWAENSTMDDGVMEVVVIAASGLADYIDVLTALSTGTQQKSELITTFRARKSVRIETEGGAPTHGDGEVLEDVWPLEAEIVPRALSVIVP